VLLDYWLKKRLTSSKGEASTEIVPNQEINFRVIQAAGKLWSNARPQAKASSQIVSLGRRGAPDFQDIRIGARLFRYPFDQVEDKGERARSELISCRHLAL